MLTEADVRQALKQTLKSDKVDSWSVDFDFRKGGALDSLDHVTFVLHLTENHGLTVRDEEVEQLSSIEAVLKFAARQAQG